LSTAVFINYRNKQLHEAIGKQCENEIFNLLVALCNRSKKMNIYWTYLYK